MNDICIVIVGPQIAETQIDGILLYKTNQVLGPKIVDFIVKPHFNLWLMIHFDFWNKIENMM